MKKIRFWLAIVGLILISVGVIFYFLGVKYNPCQLTYIEETALENCDYYGSSFWTIIFQIGTFLIYAGVLLFIIGIVFYIAFYIINIINKFNK
ncbi:MAG: hypothetical protein Q8N88_00955 [Nanoarchaeota archaeon]|nr:hypothetical protein [Nanoarchaeota archaeon]